MRKMSKLTKVRQLISVETTIQAYATQLQGLCSQPHLANTMKLSGHVED